MNDRAVNLLEQYDVEVMRTRKGRGAILCETSQGYLIFKEYTGNEERIAAQDRLLKHLQNVHDVRVETILPTKEGELFVKDNDGVKYFLKTYAEGRECNISDRVECLDSVRVLAQLHSCMEFEGVPAWLEETSVLQLQKRFYSPKEEYEKQNRELKKVRKYLKQRSQKTWFEIRLQQIFDEYLEQALTVTDQWTEYEALRKAKEEDMVYCYCHGDYQYHNLLRTDNGWFVMNFEKCILDDPVRDLYLLMRKLLEKSNWNITLGKELLATYEKKRPLSAISRIDLYYRLSYPEKFRKIANFYFNSGKAWIPGRNLEKLEKLVEQEPLKQKLLEELFCNLS